MKPVTVGRYTSGQFGTDCEGWTGWVCTDDWIMFEHEDGRLFLFSGRDPETGAVLGEPVIV